MQNDQCFAINHAVDLQALANRISEAIEYHEDKDYDSTRDMLLELHSLIYPNSRRRLTPEEAEAYYAAASQEEPVPGYAAMGYAAPGYKPLLLDETEVPDPQADASLEKLQQVVDQILDGEKEPAAFLEALEITWKIAHDCSSAMEKIESIINQNTNLKLQNQQLIGLLNMQAQEDPTGRA